MTWTCLDIKASQIAKEALIDVQNKNMRFTLRFAPNAEYTNCLENDVLSILAALQDSESAGRSFSIADSLDSKIVECAERAESEFALTGREPRGDLVIQMVTTALGFQTSITDEETAWTIFYHSLYPISQLLPTERKRFLAAGDIPTVRLESLQFLKAFDSFRGSATKVIIRSEPAVQLVYKGVTFSDFLAFKHEVFICRRDGIHREIQLLCNTIPPHPNVIPAPKALVVLNDENSPTGDDRVCGMLYPYYKNGSLAHTLDQSVAQNFRIPLSKKAKWCHQIASGTYHVHVQGRSWHQDLKPPNMLLDDEENIVIIDWEQGIGGTNTFISAPETYRDVEARYSRDEDSEIVYTLHEGPPRINNLIGTPHWDVFPDWSTNCRKAVELAEVYSLGAAMFLILEQVALERVPGKEDYSTAKMVWSAASSDIPQSWKDIVSACTRADPNERMRMKELLAFWSNEVQQYS
ncbi:hypothetical protein CC78DRAFT_531642 [Lojkania enalia]|uniref:Protein kinase domain-containing protein n=1 Tax=Lojkania enalia TaxID=147567 RepID=A0A9P4N543_9PLEO|nr:hypothetical protein CC78DRAFT_531642 [Didymosphaeria enalia]